MAELRKHRELSEIVFGLTLLKGVPNAIDPKDIDDRMLVYPYNVALMEYRDKPEEATQAYLIGKFGADAINAAKQAAKVVHNGIAPEEWLQQLTRVYQDYKIVSVIDKTKKRIEKDENANYDELRAVINDRLADQDVEPVSWADIKDEFDQEWLWAGWVPHGAVTVLVGQQGAGKSAFALYLADCLANGKALPDDSYCGEIKGVLWVETEGRFAENVRRARAWGVDMHNIYSPTTDLRRVIDLAKPEDKALVRMHASRPEVGLVVIDSLGGSLVEENDASAKVVLRDLSAMAQETDTAFLVIHHLRKSNKQSKGHHTPVLDDVRGHGGITQFSPSVIAIDYDGNEGIRFVYSLKMNLTEMPATMTFSMSGMGLLWNESTQDQVRRQVVQETVKWLEGLLSGGSKTIKQVREIATEEGYDWDIVKQAISFPSIRTIKDIEGERCLSL